MKYETLEVRQDGGVMTVTFSRPDKRNAINRQMHLDLQDLCHRLTDDTDTRVVVFEGSGPGFSAGADTSEWGAPAPADELAVRHQSGIGSRTSTAIEYLGQVTVASVHGFAIGGGVVLVSCCDFRVAEETAWFSVPEVDLGLPLGWNALPRLAREVGHARAMELTVLCERFSAQQAADYGLVTHLVGEGEARERSQELAAKVMSKPALPVALTKASMKALRRGSEMGDAAYSDADLLLYARLMAQRTRRKSESGDR